METGEMRLFALTYKRHFNTVVNGLYSKPYLIFFYPRRFHRKNIAERKVRCLDIRNMSPAETLAETIG